MSENLTREALQQELWNMLPDSCKKIMDCLKETYIESLMADIDSYCQGQKSAPIWVKASEHWPEDHNKVHWRRVEDKSPLLIVGRNYQENIIAQFGRVYTPDALEWLDESASIPTSVSDKSAFLRDYKQYKENLKYLGGPSNWKQEKINSLNKVEIFETIKVFNDLINFLDSVIYACEEGAKDWEERALNAENILQTFISRHEAGLLPDRFVYEQAKKALEG